MEHLKNALERRRGRGLDIQLIIGDGEPVVATIPVETVQAAMDGAGTVSDVETLEASSEGAEDLNQTGVAPAVETTVGEGEPVVEEEDEDGEARMALEESLGRGSLLSRFKK